MVNLSVFLKLSTLICIQCSLTQIGSIWMNHKIKTIWLSVIVPVCVPQPGQPSYLVDLQGFWKLELAFFAAQASKPRLKRSVDDRGLPCEFSNSLWVTGRGEF